MSEQDYEQLTLSAEVFPANHSVLPGSEEAKMMTVTSGLKCSALLSNSTPVGLLGKMLLESSIWRSTKCYLTWKVQATPRSRLLFRLAPSMPTTDETGPQLWLGTQTAGTGTKGRSAAWRKGKTPNLQEFVQMWPTPKATLRGDCPSERRRHSPDLASMVKLLPTPTTPRPHDTENTAGKYIASQNQKDLTYAVAQEGGQLNPTWVEWLMGFPTGWTDLNALETP